LGGGDSIDEEVALTVGSTVGSTLGSTVGSTVDCCAGCGVASSSSGLGAAFENQTFCLVLRFFRPTMICFSTSQMSPFERSTSSPSESDSTITSALSADRDICAASSCSIYFSTRLWMSLSKSALVYDILGVVYSFVVIFLSYSSSSSFECRCFAARLPQLGRFFWHALCSLRHTLDIFFF